MDTGSSSSLELPQQFRQFTLSEIHSATQNFDESLVIGRGGFGMVYKGTITDGATDLVAAIKRLDSTSNQGAVEFRAEVEMLSKLRHCHLVSLIGYCNDGQEMILVYEYMSHGTLADHLHKFQSPLTWVRRLKICLGAARGLDHLHTGAGIKHGVIHRDVKSSNILLDDSWAAKISDFGLSKLGPINQPSTYVNTFVKGTFGYLDPVYFATGRLTRKSDVYAFGVVLFEVLSGKQAVDSNLDEEHWGLVNWAQEALKGGRLKQIVDHTITDRILPKCLKEFGWLANRCLHNNPKQRPTMSDVVVSLESVLSQQDKPNYTLHPPGMKIFGNKVPMFLSSFSGDKSVGSKRSLELYFDTIGGENRILRRFDFQTIVDATENFSDSNRISGWGCGSVYKGRLQNGQGVSIDRYNSDSKYQDYKNEVALLVKLEHENLLKLLGYSIKGTQVFLVYESALYASLECLINDVKCTVLDWNKRNKIILGVASVLLYLHQNNVIHDLGRQTGLIASKWITNTGRMGYIAPEVHQTGRLSTKADVYSFGVLILVTVTGYTIHNPRGNMTFERYVYAWTNWLEGPSSDIIDPRIHVDSSTITRVIHIGWLCVQEDPTNRPTMEEVVVSSRLSESPI
ncbi:unnamed protein product [Lactuca saligna]|uniref:Protein kinase domain-containing protein n=1 Tax=Lactuca saligna TaxID=75948 RepID=A0AA35Z792_LACSI|nr:unnamed protein product [Lactuca saligna]